MQTRKEQKEKTKALLLQKAYQEFSLRGIQFTKTLDIAKAAGVAHGTVFVHFPTRDDLLMEVIAEFGMRIGKSFQEILADKEEGNVEQVLSIHLKVLEEFEPFYAQLLMESATLPKEVKNQLTFIQSGIAHYLNRELQKAIASKTIRPLPLSFLLNTWLGLIHYYLMQRELFAPGQSVIAAKGQELLNDFINLIKR
jgi:AcrR family transcriptional regulator